VVPAPAGVAVPGDPPAGVDGGAELDGLWPVATAPGAVDVGATEEEVVLEALIGAAVVVAVVAEAAPDVAACTVPSAEAVGAVMLAMALARTAPEAGERKEI
jgi:energy-converting hydrogenase Eha subunit C